MLHINRLGVWRPDSGTAFENFSTHLAPGEITLLVGQNGSGASVLLTSLAGHLAPSERRSGTVHWNGTDLSLAHRDELATVISLVTTQRATTLLTVAQMLGTQHASFSQGVTADLIEKLGLGEILHKQTSELSDSEHTRMMLVAAYLRQPKILLLDQILAALESRWKDPACHIVRDIADAGAIVMWAEQDLAQSLLVADRVVDVHSAESEPVNAWDWRPKNGPWTAMQVLASTYDVPPPAGHTVQAWCAAFAPYVSDFEYSRPKLAARGAIIPFKVSADQTLNVDSAAPPVFLCETERTADLCRRQLVATHQLTTAPMPTHIPLVRLAKRIDRIKRVTRGTTVQALSNVVPKIRIKASIHEHSQGEQSAIRTAMARLSGKTTILLEPFAFLDAEHREELWGNIHADWLVRRHTAVVTSDVDVAVEFPRVIVWDPHDGVVADGSGSAVSGSLWHPPLLSQLLPTARLVPEYSVTTPMPVSQR